MSLLERITSELKTGNESFTYIKNDLDFRLIDFWKWSVSDLVSNATRGRLAEFIIAKSLGIDTSIARNEWQAYDLETADNIKIEVKSASYIQSWRQKQLSKIVFSIKKTRSWNPLTAEMGGKPERNADVYIFALLNHTDKHSIDPLNLDQWVFYILATEEINTYKGNGSTLSLGFLEKISRRISYNEIRQELYRAVKKNRTP